MTVGSKVKQTLASVKSVQGTLKIYAEQTKSIEEKEVYKESVDTIDKVISDLQDRVRSLEYQEPDYKGN
ncbi:hypothetical protein SYNTR_1632 [Candidatus Syntrophocurvum alkaliphilum]|uniref:DUF1657 domain-containing protein n=1 Tax=Candidatus Syntrophocurvum alkaliphilum TaxID=2293317 RepID=A0A6I6DC93_9FIRM|nr:DUF1657 domain-containing protein [Candidatus Syntrophocurvum alkaliphilum]QGU00226.1 hypothetical protein SYNTR_1632 [Candidatus Syntrophocurvum alkaliphilum]